MLNLNDKSLSIKRSPKTGTAYVYMVTVTYKHIGIIIM